MFAQSAAQAASRIVVWVFDLATDKLLFEEHVAHGRNSGDNMTTSFSDVNGSYQTSRRIIQ